MSILILAHAGDALAVQVAAHVGRARPDLTTKLLTPEQLVFAPRWHHRVESGSAETAIELHDGTPIVSCEVRTVLNRIQRLEVSHFAGSKAADREYAQMEWFALLLSTLSSFRCRIVNRPQADALGGACRSPLHWLVLGAEAGLKSVEVKLTTSSRRYPLRGAELPLGALVGGPLSSASGAWGLDRAMATVEPSAGAVRTVTVIGDEVIGDPSGDPPSELAASCACLARLAGVDLLQCHFLVSQGTPWLLQGADPFLHQARSRIVRAVATLLIREADGPSADAAAPARTAPTPPQLTP